MKQRSRVYRYYRRARDESAIQALAPSEIFFLNGDLALEYGLVPFERGTVLLQWRSRGSRDGLLLLLAAIKVALLAAECNGEIKLTVKKKTRIIDVKDRLIIRQGRTTGQWPQGSLEARIGPALAKSSRALFTGHKVADLIEHLSLDWKSWRTLDVNRAVVLQLLTGIVEALEERGLVHPIQDHRKLFGVIPYGIAFSQLSNAGRKALARYDLEEVEQQLYLCERKRPAIWKLLDEEIYGGLVAALVEID
jgi:hypothetical protein